MSELRYDPIFGQWTCIAESRQSRPVEFQQLTQRRADIDCPFCRGNEAVTPPPILEWSAVDEAATSDNWLVRVFPNKFPAFESEMKIVSGSGATDPTSVRPDSLKPMQEVIVLSSRHVASLSGLSDDELTTGFSAFQNRLQHHFQREDIAHACLFMNCRPMAGASIEHTHFQLLSSPVCTNQVRQRINRMNQPSLNSNGKTAWQQRLMDELDQQVRIVEQTEHFLVGCPFASRYSNQLRIAPFNRQAPDSGVGPFIALDSRVLQELAFLCRRWVDGMQQCLIDDVAYNLIFHLPPVDLPSADWFVDLVPRFPQAAGFELATDCWVNPVSPETAAAQYRDFVAR